jgi:hypothetical protein
MRELGFLAVGDLSFGKLAIAIVRHIRDRLARFFLRRGIVSYFVFHVYHLLRLVCVKYAVGIHTNGYLLRCIGNAVPRDAGNHESPVTH